jgi:hypothetical protein
MEDGLALARRTMSLNGDRQRRSLKGDELLRLAASASRSG